jgi:putative endonuclease
MASSHYVYILASARNGTLYIGVTNDIRRRIFEHREGIGSDFTSKYNVTKLVYMEEHSDIRLAIQREKTLKEWKRAWKLDLIEKDNPNWDDLYERLNW